METIIAFITALAAGGGFGWLLRANRRKASAEAASAEESAIAQRETRYENTVAFLQSQLAGNSEEMARKSEIIRQLHDDVLQLTRRAHTMELKYIKSRCDNLSCRQRKPPLDKPESI